jgi:tetratricopeptide (TPR) repeat protein
MPPEPKKPTPDTIWIGELVADLLPQALDSLGLEAVLGVDRLYLHDVLDISPGALTRASSVRLAEMMGSSQVVVGAYDSEKQKVTITLQVIDVEQGRRIAAVAAEGPVASLQVMIDRLAWDIVQSSAGAKVAPDRASWARARPPVPIEALVAYGSGLAARDSRAGARFERAIELCPALDEARLAYGRLLLEQNENARALDVLGVVTAKSSVGRAARFRQGIALLRLGRYREAAQLYEALAKERGSAAVLNNHAVALCRLRTAAKAGAVLRRAVDAAPGIGDLMFNLGWALLVEGDAEGAAEWLRGLTEEDTNDIHAQVLLAWALRRSGRDAEAQAVWRRVLAHAPSYAPYEQPDFGLRFERVALSERLMALGPESRTECELAAAHCGRAERLLDARDSEAAIRELSQAVYLDPRNARAHLLLARARRLRGEDEAAINELKTSLWCRDEPAVALELAALYKDLGRKGEARNEARRVLKLDPRNALAKQLLE